VKTPWYDPTPGACKTLIDSGVFVDTDLYTFYLAGTGVLGVSALLYGASAMDVSIASPAMYWPANAVTFDQAKSKAVAHWKVGLDVDTWQVVVAPRNVDPASGAAWPDTIGPANFLEAVRAGALDGAELQVDRAFASSWQQTVSGVNGRPALGPTGIVTIFYGIVGSVDVGRSQVVITINSHLNLLTRDMPRRLYQSTCIHTLFDAGCTLDVASYAVTGTIAAVSADGGTITASATPPGPPVNSGTFTLGRIVMNSGKSAGFAGMVRSWTAGSLGTFTLLKPFALGVAPGDGFTAYPGCSKTYSTCAAFANTANFGGEIGIPVPETAY
jgi:hypothetical protein